ncbi:hypothetical protein GJ496_008723 [Pomphorhynchus laevis]|nr:hypothetical protein GJ496_008723 [Pomphorhynchus laevis]
MPILSLVRSGLDKMINNAGNGMKCLLMDSDTADIVNMAFNKTELIARHIFLFNIIDSSALDQSDGSRGIHRFADMNCICFLRKQTTSLDALCKHLRTARFGKYFIYFSQSIERVEIRRLAECDVKECVQLLDLINIDFIPINNNVFLPSFLQFSSDSGYRWRDNVLDQCLQSLLSLLVSMQKCPQIRYQSSSPMCTLLADQLFLRIGKESDQFLFDIENPSTLLIIDRREDPVTPILNQWVYQAMLHELLGIQKNRISTVNITSDDQSVINAATDIVLNSADDEFYMTNKYKNYGEIVKEILKLLDQYQTLHSNNTKIKSLAEMKQFIENYPQFCKMSKTVSQHMTLISEISRMVTEYKLMALSELEQMISSTQTLDHTILISNILTMLRDSKVRDIDAVRLVSLYILRYENANSNAISMFKTYLHDNRRVSSKYMEYLQCLLKYGGIQFRQTDIFNEEFSFRKMYHKSTTNGDSNKYCLHVPFIVQIAEKLLNGKLEENKYPFVKIKSPLKEQKSSEIIIFVVGGLTYEEICAINTRFPEEPPRVLLGSTGIHNFSQFIDEVLLASS